MASLFLRMVRLFAIMLSLSTMVVAGAFLPSDPPAAAAAQAPGRVPIEMDNCLYVEDVQLLPGALLRAHVPPDFRVPEIANFLIGVAECDARAEGVEERVTFGWADVQVLPPRALLSPNGGLYLFRIEHLAMDDLYGRIHGRWGTECRMLESATLRVDLTEVSAVARAGAFEQTIVAPAGPAGASPASPTQYREFGRAAGGYAYLDGKLVYPDDDNTLPGAMLTGEGSPVRSVLGPAAPANVKYGTTYSFADTELGFLAWPGVDPVASTCPST